ncbi:YbhB/YbcL family Raf kinase inhibitor-like protein [Mycolicibacterium vaccae]|uniref:YbhB/YbcL family Raf kinase inhibitor-like protein n=1 Tax=Mycolicibacterium vaccae TaxID=1810 RepID=UPI003D03113B
MKTAPGRLLRRVRAGGHRSRLARIDVPETIVVTSDAFPDGGIIPVKYAGKGVGDNLSPALRWSGVPDRTAALVLIVEDDDVPLPRPLIHTIAILDARIDNVGEGALQPNNPDIRFIKTALGRGYSGPRPIPGHGWHHYCFHLFALKKPVPETVDTVEELLPAIRLDATAHGVLTGVYRRR